jgi:hypothetical protein
MPGRRAEGSMSLGRSIMAGYSVVIGSDVTRASVPDEAIWPSPTPVAISAIVES